MDIALLVDQVLRSANIPIESVSIGDRNDRTTWKVTFTDQATDADRQSAAALIASFDPTSPAVVAVAMDAEAAAVRASKQIRAFWLFWFRETYQREPTDADRDAAFAKLVRAFQDVSA